MVPISFFSFNFMIISLISILKLVFFAFIFSIKLSIPAAILKIYSTFEIKTISSDTSSRDLPSLILNISFNIFISNISVKIFNSLLNFASLSLKRLRKISKFSLFIL